VASIALVLEHAEYPEGQPPCSPAGFGQTAPGSPSGASAFSFEVLLPCNGTYVVRANATSRGGIGRQPETAALRLRLTVAVPAAPVQALTAQQAGSADRPEVALTWEPVPEAERDPDFAGYDVERAVGDGPFELLASLPDPAAAAYLDKRTDAAGGNHRYRILSLRRAGASPMAGYVAAPHAAPEASVELPRGDEDDDGGTGDGSGGTGGDDAARSGDGTATVRRSTPGRGPTGRPGPRTHTTVDTGFDETLPFQPGEGGGQQALPTGDPAVVARLDDDGDAQKQTLALVAAGSAMGVGALALRRLLRQAATPLDVL
jgi:hypothetical protein